METGRKAWMTLLGMMLVSALSVMGKGPNIGSAINAISAMVLAFCGANAAVTWAYARADTGHDPAVEARRDPKVGFEPTP